MQQLIGLEVEHMNDKLFVETICRMIENDDSAVPITSGAALDVNIPSVVKRVKRIAQLFNQSAKIASQLRLELKSRKIPESSLIQEVSTRWNSAYAMLERYYKLADAVCVVLVKAGRAELVLRNEELEIIPDILQCLQPFLEITKVVGQEHEPTISLIVPYITSLIKELSVMKVKTPIGRSFAACLLAQTKQRLLTYEEKTVAR